MLQGQAAWVSSQKVVQQMWWLGQRSQNTHSWCPNSLVSGAGRRVISAQDHDGQRRLLTSEGGSLGRSTSSWFGPCWPPQMAAPLTDGHQSNHLQEVVYFFMKSYRNHYFSSLLNFVSP